MKNESYKSLIRKLGQAVVLESIAKIEQKDAQKAVDDANDKSSTAGIKYGEAAELVRKYEYDLMVYIKDQMKNGESIADIIKETAIK